MSSLSQSVVLQVGQCGNQIGWRFWDSALRELGAQDTSGLYTHAVATLFRNVPDVRSSSALRCGTPLRFLKARALLIDAEEGVVNQVMASELGELFDHRHLLTDVSGSGNNWAVGYYEYGRKYRDTVLEMLRSSLEECDNPRTFIMLNSLGGGTGSGFGSRMLQLMCDHFPKIFRFVTTVVPSQIDDVRCDFHIFIAF